MSHVHSPSARYRLQCTPDGCAYGCPKGAPITTCEKVHPKVTPFGVNFGHNYRYLGHFVRVTFMPKLPAPVGYLYGAQFLFVRVLPSATLRGPQCTSCIWVPYRAPISRFHFVISFFTGSFGPSNAPSGAYGYPIGHPLENNSFFSAHCRVPTPPAHTMKGI